MLFFLPHWRESRRTSARILERRLQIGPSSRRCKLGRGKRTYCSPEERRKKKNVSAIMIPLDEPRCHGWADAKVWRPPPTTHQPARLFHTEGARNQGAKKLGAEKPADVSGQALPPVRPGRSKMRSYI